MTLRCDGVLDTIRGEGMFTHDLSHQRLKVMPTEYKSNYTQSRTITSQCQVDQGVGGHLSTGTYPFPRGYTPLAYT